MLLDNAYKFITPGRCKKYSPSSGVVTVTDVVFGPIPMLVCAAMKHTYVVNGLSVSTRSALLSEKS